MAKKKVWTKPEDGKSRRRREWVELDNGWVCVWEMSAAGSVQIIDRSARPSVDQRGGFDRGEVIWWQILLSCMDSDEEDAKPIWGVQDLEQVMNLRYEELQRIDQACKRVNGMTAGELDAIQSFMTPKGANGTGSSVPGVSNSSAGSLRK